MQTLLSRSGIFLLVNACKHCQVIKVIELFKRTNWCWLSGPNKHQSAVTCLQFNTKFVVTSSDDGTVKLWDVKTGRDKFSFPKHCSLAYDNDSEDINEITLGEFIRDLVALESGGSGGVVWRIRSSPTKLVRLS